MAIVKRPNRSQTDIASERLPNRLLPAPNDLRPSRSEKSRSSSGLIHISLYVWMRPPNARGSAAAPGFTSWSAVPWSRNNRNHCSCSVLWWSILFPAQTGQWRWLAQKLPPARADPALTRPTHSISSLQWSAEAREQPVCLLSLLSL